MTMHSSKLIVEVLSLFPNRDNKMVPWNYNYNYVNEPVAGNISGIGGIIGSGRCYVLVSAKIAPLNPVKKLPKQKKPDVTSDEINELITEKASKFLKFIKHNEYNVSVVDQLNKLSARISLLAILMNFEPYQKALSKLSARIK